MSKTKITNETFSIGFDGIAFDRHEIPELRSPSRCWPRMRSQDVLPKPYTEKT